MLNTLIALWIMAVAIGIFPAILWNAYEIRHYRKAISALPVKDRTDRIIALLEEIKRDMKQ